MHCIAHGTRGFAVNTNPSDASLSNTCPVAVSIHLKTNEPLLTNQDFSVLLLNQKSVFDNLSNTKIFPPYDSSAVQVIS